MPCPFVSGCSDAGNIVVNLNRFMGKHEQESMELRVKNPNSLVTASYSDCIRLAARWGGETLPVYPDIPSDLFTCCLITIEIAIRFLIIQNPLLPNFTVEHAMEIP